jgi:hypothetical protein
MATIRACWIGLVVLRFATGCGATSNASARPAKDVATEIERTRCAGVDEAALAPIFEGRLAESVEPINVTLGSTSKYGPETRLTGAFIRLRPPDGMTAAWLDRALECHSARRVLGRIPSSAVPNDPFYLPGTVVDIAVESKGDSFWIAVRGRTPDEAKAILQRAAAFVAANAQR